MSTKVCPRCGGTHLGLIGRDELQSIVNGGQPPHKPSSTGRRSQYLKYCTDCWLWFTWPLDKHQKELK